MARYRRFPLIDTPRRILNNAGKILSLEQAGRGAAAPRVEGAREGRR